MDVLPILNVTLSSPAGGPVPTSIQSQFTWNGTAQGWTSAGVGSHQAGDVYAWAMQLGSPVAATDDYAWSVEVKITLPDNSLIDLTAGGDAAPVVVGADPVHFAPGFGISGIDARRKGPQLELPSSSFVELFRKGASMDRFFSRRDLLRGIGAVCAALVGSRALGLAAEGAKPKATKRVPTPEQSVAARPEPPGAPQDYSYDPCGHVTRFIYPAPRSHTAVYDAHNRIVSCIDGPGRPLRHG